MNPLSPIRLNFVQWATMGALAVSWLGVGTSRLVAQKVHPYTLTLPAEPGNRSATLRGKVNPGGLATVAWFEWGAPGHERLPTPRVFVGDGIEPVPLSVVITDLVAEVVYRSTIVASNRDGVIRGRTVEWSAWEIDLVRPNPLTHECHTPFRDPLRIRGAVLALVAGNLHNLALWVDGSVAAWGWNGTEQTTVPEAARRIVAVAAGGDHSLAVTAEGTVLGWGRNAGGQTTIPTAATQVVAVAAGGDHSLALRDDGTVLGWGDNGSGQLAIPTDTRPFTAIATGYGHALGVTTDGRVRAWGRNSEGQVNVPADATNVVAIAAGFFHSLALKAGGSVVAWGWNSYGQVTVPTNATRIVGIAAGGNHSLALTASGTVLVWGDNSAGQTAVPAGLSNVVTISAGGAHSLSKLADGSIAGWGRNDHRQAGASENMGDSNVSRGLEGVFNPDLPGNYTFTYRVTNVFGAVVTTQRTVRVADTTPPVVTLRGLNPFDLLLGLRYVEPGAVAADACDGDLTSSLIIRGQIDPDVPGTQIVQYAVEDASGNRAMSTRSVRVGLPREPAALPATEVSDSGATLHGWVNPGGLETVSWFEYGPGVLFNRRTPNERLTPGRSPRLFDALIAGLSPGIIYAYRVVASNAAGIVRSRPERFGAPAIALHSPDPLRHECHTEFQDPVTVEAAPVAFGAGSHHGLVVRLDGKVVAWGYNGAGQINVPASATNVVAVVGGEAHSLALRSDGTIVGWGYNFNGQVTIPPEATQIVAVAAEGYRSLALRRDGTVVAWGDNGAGQSTPPVSLSNVVSIAAGDRFTLALQSDGSVIGWGLNSVGQLDIPNAATGVVAIAAGAQHSLALRSDGSVIAWGQNQFGQSQVPLTATNVVEITAGQYFSLALRQDGAIVAWGRNDEGQTRLPPEATNIAAIAAGGAFSLATRDDGRLIAWGHNTEGETNVPAETRRLEIPLTRQGTVDTNQLGTYSLNYSATTPSGTTSSARRTVEVVDTTPPTLALVGPEIVSLPVRTTFSDPGAIASDTCAGNLSQAIARAGTVNSSQPGAYRLTYSVADPSGSLTTRSRLIRVGDPQVSTLGASSIVNDRATLHGQVKLNGAEAVAWFEWGRAHDTPSRTAPTFLRESSDAVSIQADVAELMAGVVYRYQTVASNAAGVIRGNVLTLWIPVVQLTSPEPLVHECHVPFGDPVIFRVPVVAIAAGLNGSAALRADGTLLRWGGGARGASVAATNLTTVKTFVTGDFGAVTLDEAGVARLFDGRRSTNRFERIVGLAAGPYTFLLVSDDGQVLGSDGRPIAAATGHDVRAVATSDTHSLALTRSGSVIAWGANDFGQTTVPSAATQVVAVAAGTLHSLALRADGAAIAWGRGIEGETNVPPEATNVIALAAGYLHSLALRADGRVIAWGLTNSAQTQVPSEATNVVAIAAGTAHSLALRADGVVITWGFNGAFQTDIPPEVNTTTRNTSVSGQVNVDVPGSYPLHYVASNSLGAIATRTRTVVVRDTAPPALRFLGPDPLAAPVGVPFVDPGGTALDACEGDVTTRMIVTGHVNTAEPGTYPRTYEVADSQGNRTNRTRLVHVGLPAGAATLPATGVSNTTATLNAVVTPNGVETVAWFEWGAAYRFDHRTPPVAMGKGLGVVTFSAVVTNLAPGTASYFRLVATNLVGIVRSEERMLTTLAIPLRSDEPLFHACHQPFVHAGLLPDPTRWLGAGNIHSVALKSDGTVVAWGWNGISQTTVPGSVTSVVAIAAGGDHTLAVRANGTVVGWGANTFGQAVPPAAARDVVAVAAAGAHSLALRQDGTVIGWGENGVGQLNVPAHAVNIVAIATGYSHTLALRRDGTLVAWGANEWGQTTIPQLATNIVAIASGFFHNLALRTDGTVVAWGRNDSRQGQVPAGFGPIRAIAAGGYHNVVLTGGGEVVAWGANGSGQTAVPAEATNILAIAAGGEHSLASRADGQVVGWGRNDFGQSTLPPELRNELGTPVMISGRVDPEMSGTYVLTYFATNRLGASASATRLVVVGCPSTTRPRVTETRWLVSGEFELTFTNATDAQFTVLTTTNVAASLSDWEVLGAARPLGYGRYRFADPDARRDAIRFYRLRSP